MSYQQQPGNWGDQSWPGQQPYADPAAPTSPYTDPSSYAPYAPASGQPYAPASGQPAAYGPAYAYPGYAAPAGPTTNGMAVASMVLSIAGAALLVCYGAGGVLAVIGAILGHVARKQIRERGEGGDGMALAGVIVGWVAAGLAVLGVAAFVIFFVWLASQDPSTYDGTTYFLATLAG